MSRTISSALEMQAFAAEMARSVRGRETRQHGGHVLLLFGELGAGKTTFVQGLARALGVTEQVTSPTFTIAGEYEVPPEGPVTAHPHRVLAESARPIGVPRAVPPSSGVISLVHVDLYRLDEKTAVSDPAVQEVLERANESGRLTVIEWADRLGESAPAGARRIYFQHGKDSNERVVEYTA